MCWWIIVLFCVKSSLAFFKNFSSHSRFLLFCSLFNFHRFNDFGKDGGPAAHALEPKFHTFSNHVSTHTGFRLHTIAVRNAFSSIKLKLNEVKMIGGFHYGHILIFAIIPIRLRIWLLFQFFWKELGALCLSLATPLELIFWSVVCFTFYYYTPSGYSPNLSRLRMLVKLLDLTCKTPQSYNLTYTDYYWGELWG